MIKYVPRTKKSFLKLRSWVKRKCECARKKNIEIPHCPYFRNIAGKSFTLLTEIDETTRSVCHTFSLSRRSFFLVETRLFPHQHVAISSPVLVVADSAAAHRTARRGDVKDDENTRETSAITNLSDARRRSTTTTTSVQRDSTPTVRARVDYWSSHSRALVLPKPKSAGERARARLRSFFTPVVRRRRRRWGRQRARQRGRWRRRATFVNGDTVVKMNARWRG